MGDSLRAGRWTLGEQLGEGSQGTTWAAEGADGLRVAVKRFDVRGARSWKDVELAEREARVLGQLSHARLPAYVEHFEEGGALYLVMQLMDGESLASLRKRGALLSEKEVWRFLADASEVLEYLHGRAPPVIHRDLKPGNVIRRPDGSFAFVDFGAVRDKLRPEGGSTVVGTFGYMAPEQFQGRAQPSSDVYSVGATALAMLTGAEPESLPHKGLGLDVRAALGPSASDAMVRVLSEMLEPDPDRRAPRLAPLLEQRRKARPSRPGEIFAELERDLEQRFGDRPREIAQRIRDKTERWIDEESRRAERRAERTRERDERHARRADKRRAREEASAKDRTRREERISARRAHAWRDAPPPAIGGFFGFHTLQIVRLFLFFGLAIVPALVLSLLGLRKVAQAVRAWHRDTVDGELQAAQAWLRAGYVARRAEEAQNVRVEAPTEAKVRVAAEHDPATIEEEEVKSEPRRRKAR